MACVFFFSQCKCGGMSQERTAGVVKVLAGWLRAKRWRTRVGLGSGGAAYKLFLTQCKGGGSGIDSGRPVS